MHRTLAQAEALTDKGHWREAIALLGSANRLQPSVELERKLVDLRIQAHQAIDWPERATPWAGDWADVSERTPSVLEIDAVDFTAENLAAGVLGHGALIVRNLVPREVTGELIDHIENTIAAREQDDEASPWDYQSPFVTGKPGQFQSKDAAKRAKVKKGSIWVPESPRTMQRLIELYDEIGLRAILSDYLGEAPALSVRKWVLRRIMPDAMEAGWHQDGKFMGTEYNSVNMWLPLSECGEGARAAGMEIMPNLSREIFETGTRGAAFKWTVGKELVEDLKKDWPIQHPHFEPGDALFFDHYNLHRTAFGEHLTEPRYAVESWFFGSSGIPAKQMPILF